MADIDKLESLLTSFGVPHKLVDFPDYEYSVKVGGYTHQSDPRNTVTGYRGFYTMFNFDEGGKFICMGAWE